MARLLALGHHLLARRVADRRHLRARHRTDAGGHAAGSTALGAGPILDGFPRGGVPIGRSGGGLAATRRGRFHLASADEMGAQRCRAGHSPIRHFLRHSLHLGSCSVIRDGAQHLLVGADSAHVGLCDCSLSSDGRRCHLSARLCLHLGDVVGAGHLLRLGLLRDAFRQSGGIEPVRLRNPHRHRHLRLSADSPMDPGEPG